MNEEQTPCEYLESNKEVLKFARLHPEVTYIFKVLRLIGEKYSVHTYNGRTKRFTGGQFFLEDSERAREAFFRYVK